MAYSSTHDGVVYSDNRRPVLDIVSCLRMRSNPKYPMRKYFPKHKNNDYDLFVVAIVRDRRFKEKKRYQTMRLWKDTNIQSLGIKRIVAMDWGFCPEHNLLPCRGDNHRIAEEFLVSHALDIKMQREHMYLEVDKVENSYIELVAVYG